MSRVTYVYRDGEMIDKRHAPPLRYQRSSLSAPYIRTDGMAETVNPVDGRPYDSKSAYERAVRDAGCVIVGDDSGLTRTAPPQFEAAGVGAALAETMDKFDAGWTSERIVAEAASSTPDA